mgnify:FL=1
MKIDYCAKIKAGLFLPAFTLMLELSGKTLAMCLFPGMPIVVELNEAEFEDADFKSDNLQYSTLVRWFAGTNDLLTKRRMFQIFFFICSRVGSLLCLMNPIHICIVFSFHYFLQNSLQK